MTAVRRVIPVCMVLGLVFDPSCNRMMDAQTVEDVMVPMRDGVSLPTRIWRPIEAGVYPAVLTRGYTVGGLGERYYGKLRVSQCFTDAGYVFVDQQCRGEGGAEGGRFFPDDDDGYDCIEWVGRQAWCNGQVAMWGGSYWGATQWRAAVAQPPSLKAIVPGFVNAEHWKQGYRSQGAIHLKMTTQSNRAIPRGTYTLDDWKQMLMYLPLIDMDYEFLGREDPLWNDYISHSCYDDYWKAIGMREGCKYEKVNVPTYIMAGFRDYYAGAAFESYLVLRAVGNVAEIRIHVGDYGHSGAPDIPETIKWLDYVLKGKDTGIENQPPVVIKVRGASWRYEDQWPLENTQFTKFFFHSPDGARIGTLRTFPATEGLPTVYHYDPADPALTLGANGSHESIPGLIEGDPVDQRLNESRQDVLVYTSEELASEMTVAGPIEAVLYAASSAPDTDFTVKLIDVHPDGTALNVTEGIVRARFRDSIWDPPTLISPGEIYEYRIELLPVAVKFAQGHRIRVHLSSSSWPLWDRNQNTGHSIGMDAEIQVAEQTVYHDACHPSHILLPIVDGGNDIQAMFNPDALEGDLTAFGEK